MLKRAALLCSMTMAACGGNDDTDPLSAYETCEATGHRRCADTRIQECNGVVWLDVEDCADANRVCLLEPDYTGVALCGLPAGVCHHSDYASLTTIGYYDPDTLPYHLLTSTDAADTPSEGIDIENYPTWQGNPGMAPGAVGTVELTAAASNDNYEECGVCVMAHRYQGASTQTFMPRAGTIEFVSTPAALGEEMTVVLRDVELREVSIGTETTDVFGGAVWCIPGPLTLTTTATAWPCARYGMQSGDVVCVGTTWDPPHAQIWECTGEDVLAQLDDCEEARQTCDPAATSPVCE